jgi:hypothetical protein
MSDNSLNISASDTPRRPILLAVGLGLVLLVLAAAIAPLGIMAGLLVFNGCFGSPNPFIETLAMIWIFVLWPVAVLVTALVPPVLLGVGRGGRPALIAFLIGCAVSVSIWVVWLILGYTLLC